MLILSRKAGDAIVIDGGIRLVVIACDRRGVRLGIDAPAHVSIVREEIVAQVADENRRAPVPEAPSWLRPAVGGADVVASEVAAEGPAGHPAGAQERRRSRR